MFPGTATPIGDPPNILIVNSPKIKATGMVNFGSFVLHIGPGVILTMIVGFIILYFKIAKLARNPQDPVETEIQIWRRTLNRMNVPVTEEERLVKEKLEAYINDLEISRRKTPGTAGKNSQEYEKIEEGEKKKRGDDEEDDNGMVLSIEALEAKYIIHDMPLFIKCCGVLLCVVSFFFIHSFVTIHLNLAWIAVIGAMSLLLLSGIRDMDKILEKIEVSTLLFFAGLFVLMRALEELGLMHYIATLTAHIIHNVPEGDFRISVAVILIIWVGAIASAFVDNIPFTQTLLPVVIQLAESPDLGIPYPPLLWSLPFGVSYLHTHTTLHYTTLHYTTLHYTTLHYTTLHYTCR